MAAPEDGVASPQGTKRTRTDVEAEDAAPLNGQAAKEAEDGNI